MRLIDADEIIKWADDSVSQYGNTYSTDMLNMFGLFKEVIVNAPTVSETKLVANVTFNKEEVEELVEKAKADILAQIERPQGEWIFDGEDTFKCSVCNTLHCCGDNFCPNCGARMGGKT